MTLRRITFALFLFCGLAAAAITFGVASVTNINSGAQGVDSDGDLAVTLPAGWTAGEVALLLLYLDSGDGSTPSGWTEVTGSPFGSAMPKLCIFYRRLEAGDGNPTTTVSGLSGCAAGAMMTFAGVDTAVPIDAVGAGSQGTGTPMTAPSVNIVTAAAWAVGCCGRGDNEVAGSQTFGGSATGVTERLDAGTNTGNDAELSGYSKEFDGAAASGEGLAVTSATDPWVSVILVLRPLPAAAGNPSNWFQILQ
jgi:hypothetical protein